MVEQTKGKAMPLVGNGGDQNKTCPPAPTGKADRQPSLLEHVAMKKSLWAQCIMNGAIILLVTGSGMPIGFSAILLPQLQAPDSILPTDDDWASWIASIHSVVSPLGALLVGPLMDRFGRRRMLQLSVIPLVLGWLIMSAIPNHLCLLAGRMLAGFAVGMTPGTSQVLISEVTEPRLRGVFGSAPNIAYSLGILLVYALGSMFSWRMVAVISSLLPGAGLLLMLALPESPVWLVRQGRTDKARKNLLWLRGDDHSKVNQELHQLVMQYKADEERQLEDNNTDDPSCNVYPQKLNCLSRPEVFKPFLIILIFCFLQILSGSYIVIFYGVKLISNASGTSETELSNMTVAVMTALVRFIVSIITTVCLISYGRRRIGIISGLGTALACFTLVIFLQLKNHDCIQLDTWVSTSVISALIMVYVALNTFGIFSLPCLMLGEVLPASVRGFISGILLMLINLMIFLTTKLYPNVGTHLGSSGIFLVFAIVSLILTLFLYLFLPETKGRPLTQIEQYFAIGKNFLWSSRDKTLISRNKDLFG